MEDAKNENHAMEEDTRREKKSLKVQALRNTVRVFKLILQDSP